MGYNQKAKFIKNSPLPCWKGYERVPGTAQGAEDSCRKSSPTKLDLTKKSGFGPRAAKGDDDQSKELAISRYEMGEYKKSPAKVTQKGGGTKKVCLPKAKIASMSKAEKSKVIRAKRAAAAKGKYRRSSKSNVTGTSSGGSLKRWLEQDWRQVGNPSKKCGEK